MYVNLVRCHHPGHLFFFFLINSPSSTWNMPHVAKVLASAANYMICDDHEFTDDLGEGTHHWGEEGGLFGGSRVKYVVD